jgi:Predicted metal-dependent phosphoesterases (PHP family)
MSRPVSLDPHVHTSASRDSTADVETVLGSAERAGLDAVAVTDHDTMAGPSARSRPPGRATWS